MIGVVGLWSLSLKYCLMPRMTRCTTSDSTMSNGRSELTWRDLMCPKYDLIVDARIHLE